MLRWIGAVLIVAGCGGCGMVTVRSYLGEEAMLRQLEQVLRYMISDLNYRRSPLPVLCRESAVQGKGLLREILLDLAAELEKQVFPDAESCMAAILDRHRIEDGCRDLLTRVGQTFGHFDLDGQIRELEAVLSACGQMLNEHCSGKKEKIRTIRTLGISAGIVLAILLF